MKLVVLAGAKEGAAVPIKKSSFIIGRGKDCSLRAGSDAISRQHCELQLSGAGVTVRDLGSRNGTFVNDQKIEGVHPLTNGDKLKIGPLEFRFESDAQLREVKVPKIKNMSDAVLRAASKTKSTADSLGEDDISEWLLGEPGSTEMPAIGETLSLRSDETRVNPADALADRETQIMPALTAEPDADGADKKKGPGKLPFRPEEKKSKDSQEAAANALRNMSRRR